MMNMPKQKNGEDIFTRSVVCQKFGPFFTSTSMRRAKSSYVCIAISTSFSILKTRVFTKLHKF